MTGAWDLTSFLVSATRRVEFWGGLLLMLFGTVAMIWAAIMLLKRLSFHAREVPVPWRAIIPLFVVGAALATGGFQLIDRVGSGGEQTITELGGGTAVLVPVEG